MARPKNSGGARSLFDCADRDAVVFLVDDVYVSVA